MLKKQKGICKTIRGLIASIDHYGAPVNLAVAGEEKSKSVIGTIITLLPLGLTILLSMDVIKDVINKTNPNIVLDSEYNVDTLYNLTDQEVFLALSFYTPNDGKNKIFSDEFTNYTATKTINHLSSQCYHNCSNSTFNMLKCPNRTYDYVTALKGMSTKGAANVTDIFKKHSYCMPQNVTFDLKDNDPDKPDFISSLVLTIDDTYLQNNSPDTKRLLNMQPKPAPPPNQQQQGGNQQQGGSNQQQGGFNQQQQGMQKQMFCPICKDNEYCQNGQCVKIGTVATITTQKYNTYDDKSALDCKLFFTK